MPNRLLPALFSVTLFVSASLLFLVQPMIAKFLLPLLGGTPAVWTTCMLFFQAALLAGYCYAHLASHRLGRRAHVLLHLLVLAAAALMLPLALPQHSFPHEEAPVLWILQTLALTVGLPFVAIAATAPLLQRWFASTGHPSAGDPYYLYAASNCGSLLALVGYPLLVEPRLTLQEQSTAWAVGYAGLWLLTAVCAWTTYRSPSLIVSVDRQLPIADPRLPISAAGPPRPLRWLVLAFVPASLLLSVTTYLTTDIAAIPLLWVLPLALYLLTFTLAFARRSLVPRSWMLRIMPAVVVMVTIAMLAQATEPIALLMSCHLLLLFVVAMVCHGELARLRPPVEQLTGFYLWISLGGVLAGIFNSLVAPLIFPGLAEYPLVLVLACLVAPPRNAAVGPPTVRDLLWPLALGGITAGLIVVGQRQGLHTGPLAIAVMFALPAVLCYTMLDRPVRFGLAVAALFLAGLLYEGVHGVVLDQQRSFFGVHRVALGADGNSYVLIHGNTVHGRQFKDPARQREPLMYYHRSGPAGRAFEVLQQRGEKRPVAVVGLGAGSLAMYGQKGQEFTFYEIDPVVIRFASDPSKFSFLHDSPATVDIVAGDARLMLAKAPGKYGVIVIDAFSSDAIPIHLLTREALAVYRSKLADDGVLLFHISNRYVDLAPVLGDLAADAGLWAQVRNDLSSGDPASGKLPSQWVLMTPTKTSLMPGAWEALRPRPEMRVWTDDYSNLVGAVRWNPFRHED
jgi:hypothetical protein